MLRRVHSLPSPSTILSILLLCVLCVVSTPGCVVGDFLGVYFNTLYNAQHQFNEAQDEVWSLPEARLTGKNYLAPLPIQQSTRTKLTSVIEKCSKLLQYHPDSRYVDDALMMIGKSYYYQGDFQKAERKFSELINGYPESGYRFEAQYLLAYCYYQLKSNAEAQTLAKDVADAAVAAGNDDVLARASLVLGQMQADDGNFTIARDFLERAATHADNSDLRAATWLRVGQVDSSMGDHAASEKAYRRAVNESGNYVVQYRGLIGAVRALQLQARYDDALALLLDLRSNQNYREFFGEVEFEIGNTYAFKDDPSDAITQYRHVDSLYARTETGAKSYYKLGMLYEKRLFWYDSARIAFARGAAEAPQSSVGQQLAHHADYLNSYFKFHAAIAKYDSIRTALLAPPDTAARGRDSLTLALQNRTDTSRVKPPAGLPITLDTVEFRLATYESELAGLFYTTIGRSDSAIYWYTRVITGFPESPLVPRGLYTLAQIYSLDSTATRGKSDSLYREIIRRFPGTPFADEATRILGLAPLEKKIDSASVVYVSGERLILAGNGPAAIDTMHMLIDHYPSSPYASKAQYAIGWVYENILQKPDSALVCYRELVRRFPLSLYATQVRPLIAQVDLELSGKGPAARSDTTLAPANALEKKTAPGQEEPRTNRERRRGRGPEDAPPSRPGGGGQDQ